MSPKVSIQIPTYNQQAFIQQTVESCFMQDYTNIEIIVADDNSKDNTSTVIQPLLADERLTYRKNETNIGRVANYHKALYEYCTGDWAVNLDGDDQFTDPRFISYAMELISKQQHEEVVVFQANHNLKKIKELFPNHVAISNDAVMIDGKEYFLKYYRVRRFRHCATIFKRATALPLNFYSFDCLFTDFNAVSKLFLQGKVIICGRTVAHWNLHDSNQSSGLSEENIHRELNSIHNIAVFAKPYFTHNSLMRWEKEMKRYMVETYIELLINRPRRSSSLKYIMKHFKPDMIYFKQLIKYFIRR